MNFNKHSNLLGEHAFLGGSRYHWINYDDEKLRLAYTKYLAIQQGNDLHDLARRLIELRVKLPKTDNYLNRYVNDAIGFRMTPEQTLFYSINAYGTADAISFRDQLLRIHDLKTGVSLVSIRQLEVYASLFCLEYSENPGDISIELRIYQKANEVFISIPDPEEIEFIMNKIVVFDREIEKLKAEDGNG